MADDLTEGMFDQNKKGYKTNMGGSLLRSLALWSAGAVMVMLIWNGGVGRGVNAQLSTTNETMVAEKGKPFQGPCMDGSTNIMNDLEEWTTGCNRIVCHVEPSRNYTVTYGCRELVPSDNPDDINCVTVENTALAYPNCCPELDCGSGTTLTTANPSACVDISSSRSCDIWYNLSSSCTNSSHHTWTFATNYCQATCGICSVG